MSIIELFHLLPSAGGSKFLDRLVHITMQLESVLPKFHLPRVLHSPYRTPLIKYLNLYAKEAVDFFLAHLTDVALRPFFAFILRSPEAQPLRDELRRNPKGIVDATFRANLGIDKVATKLELQCLGVRIVYCLARNNADILDEHPILLTALTDLWNDRFVAFFHYHDAYRSTVGNSKTMENFSRRVISTRSGCSFAHSSSAAARSQR